MNESKPPPKSLILIGFMGCGKSTVGRELQTMLGYPLVDMDHLIEERTGRSIPEIFAENGEESFRDLESGLLEELTANDTERRIISTGGGVVKRPHNRELLRQLGYVIWLKASAEHVLERTAKNRNRPLLQTEDPLGTIRQLMVERDPLYAETAHLQLDTAGLSSNEVATGILHCARYYFTHQPQTSGS